MDMISGKLLQATRYKLGTARQQPCHQKCPWDIYTVPCTRFIQQEQQTTLSPWCLGGKTPAVKAVLQSRDGCSGRSGRNGRSVPRIPVPLVGRPQLHTPGGPSGQLRGRPSALPGTNASNPQHTIRPTRDFQPLSRQQHQPGCRSQARYPVGCYVSSAVRMTRPELECDCMLQEDRCWHYHMARNGARRRQQ